MRMTLTVYTFCDNEHEVLDGSTCAGPMPSLRECKAYLNGEQNKGMHAANDAFPLTVDQQYVLGALKEFVAAGMGNCFLGRRNNELSDELRKICWAFAYQLVKRTSMKASRRVVAISEKRNAGAYT